MSEENDNAQRGCEICGRTDVDVFNLLGIKQANGNLDTLACTQCAKERGWICEKHDSVHQGFEDGTHACLECIHEMARDALANSQSFLVFLREKMPQGKFDELWEKAEGYSAPLIVDAHIYLARTIAALALRRNKSFQQILEDIVSSGDFTDLFPGDSCAG